MGKAVLTEANVEVPEGVEITVKNKVVSVKGPRGKISKGFENIPVLFRNAQEKSGKKLNISVWFKNRKQKSLAKTMASLVDNMVIGVTKGYRYVMKYGHKRHPMKPASNKEGTNIKIANYLGAQEVRSIDAPAGVNIKCDEDDKAKEIIVTGIDNESVGTCCAKIHQSCRPRKLDRRKFEDGLYIQVRGLQEESK